MYDLLGFKEIKHGTERNECSSKPSFSQLNSTWNQIELRRIERGKIIISYASIAFRASSNKLSASLLFKCQ